MIRSRYLSYVNAYIVESDVHDRLKASIPASERILLMAMCLFFLALDSALVWLAVIGAVPASVALGVHAGTVLIAWMFVSAKERMGFELLMAKVMVFSVALTGPFGALGGIVTLIAHLYQRHHAFSFQQWFDAIYPTSATSMGETLYDDIILGVDEQPRAYDVVPYMDVMRLGSDAQKREAINQMTLQFQPKFTPALQLALRDTSQVVRTLAAISVVKIQSHFLQLEMQLKKAVTRHETRSEYLLAAARFYDDFAFCGLLDKQRQDDYMTQAYEYYQKYLRHEHEDTRVFAWIGRLLIRSGQYERAAEWLRQAIDSGRLDPLIIGWYAEALYALGRFHDLRHLMQRHGEELQAVGEGALVDVVQFWQQGVAA